MDIPVICAGRFDDPALADPELANKFKEERLDDVRRLIEWYRKQMGDTGVHVLLNTELYLTYYRNHGKTKKPTFMGFFVYRSDKIRTCGLYLPKVAL